SCSRSSSRTAPTTSPGTCAPRPACRRGAERPLPSRTPMTQVELQVTSALHSAPVDEIADVDRDAFTAPGYDETPDDVARFRTSLPRHAARPGFRLVLAREPGQVGLVEFAYGYTGEPGRWWTDRLLERIPPG